jgi:hypothetical protein
MKMRFSKQWLFIPSLSHLITILAFIVGIVGYIYLEHTKIEIQVPNRDLPAYYKIKPGDLRSETYAKKDISSQVLKNSQELVGRYTLTKIPKQKLLTEKLVSSKIDSNRLVDTVVVGIPATPAMILGGNLQAGDTVEMTLVPTTTKAESLPSPVVFSNILVLDVKSVSQASASSTSVVVVALPSKRRQEFASKSPGATFLLTRKL